MIIAVNLLIPDVLSYILSYVHQEQLDLGYSPLEAVGQKRDGQTLDTFGHVGHLEKSDFLQPRLSWPRSAGRGVEDVFFHVGKAGFLHPLLQIAR